MKKLWLICLSLFVLIGCQSNTTMKIQEYVSEGTVLDESLDHYKIIAKLDDDERILTCDQTIEYTNRDGEDHQEIYLHIYPNIFSEDNQPDLYSGEQTSELHSALDISKVLVNEEEAVFKGGKYETIVKVLGDFKAGETYDIQLSYKVKVSSTTDRFGYRDGVYHLCNWYPILAVYDEDGWNLDPYLFVGDPFYSEMATYDITLSLPKDFVAAGSGSIVNLERNNLAVYRFEANKMRDFAIVMSNDFLIDSKQVNDTMVQLYYQKSIKNHKSIDDALLYGAKSIETFEKVIGDYPYDQYSVVLTEFDSGMEYPGLVLIAKNYMNYPNSALKEVIIHETVHQWFYGLIGGDEIDEGWIDEGLTTYFTAYYDIANGEKSLYDQAMANYQYRVDDVGFDNIEVAKTSYYFDNWSEYGVAAYSKPALLYHYLYETYGDEKIQTLAKSLYNQYAYGILKEEGLRQTLVEIYSEDIEETLNNWWY